MHLAELNVGRLVAPTDDPRVADFMDNLDRINGLAKRMPGFQWMMEGGAEGAGNTAAKIESDDLYIPNLSVWSDVASLEKFVWGTIHKQFYERRAEWFEVLGSMHFVMWWVPQGHRPSLEEALARLDHLRDNGDSEHAFGWSWLKEARMWRSHGCSPQAAE
jgi:hypothetical protein